MATKFKRNQFNFVGLGNKNKTFYLNKQEFPNYSYINPNPYFSYINTSNLSPLQSFKPQYQSLNFTKTIPTNHFNISGIIYLNKNNIKYEINFKLQPLIELWNIKTNLNMELTFDIQKPRNEYQITKTMRLGDSYKPQDIDLLIDYKWINILEPEQYHTMVHLNYQITDTKINNPITIQGKFNYGSVALLSGIVTRNVGRNSEKISDNPITPMKYKYSHNSINILLSIPTMNVGRYDEKITDNQITSMKFKSNYQGYAILLNTSDILIDR